MKLIDNAHTQVLAKMMDVYSLRNKITSANIANIDTPGYRKSSVNFEEILARYLESGRIDKDTIGNLQPTVETHDEKPVLENELLEMADTQMRVQLTARALRHNFEQLRMGIVGRTG